LQTENDQLASGMFQFLEKKAQKRIFYSYLYQFELAQHHLGTNVSRQLLSEIHKHSCAVSYRFDEPVAVVSRNIINAAAWGTIYCLLGPGRMLEIAPSHAEIVNEVEIELFLSCADDESENSIYRQVFSILSANDLCHPEIEAQIEASLNDSLNDPSAEEQRRSTPF
jgi:hypothetical protein